jgi:hypothetical protein
MPPQRVCTDAYRSGFVSKTSPARVRVQSPLKRPESVHIGTRDWRTPSRGIARCAGAVVLQRIAVGAA